MKAMIVAAALLFPCASLAAPWSTYQGNAEHTGHVPVSLALQAPPLLRWEAHPFDTGIGTSGIAVGAGRVFVVPSGQFRQMAPLVSLALDSGQERWRVDFGAVFTVNPPALDNRGTVFLATVNHASDTYLRAYDSETGTFRWRSAMAAQWGSYLAPTIVDGQVASNGGYYGGLYTFDAATGDTDHFAALPQCDQMTPVPWRDAWVTLTNRIDIVDRASGSLRTIPIAGGSCNASQTPVIVGDVAYFTDGGRLTAVNLVDGSTLFQRNIGAYGQISSDGSRLYVVASGAISVRDLDGNYLGGLEVASQTLLPPLILTRTHLIAATAGGSRTAILDLAGLQPAVLLDHGGAMALVDGLLVVAATGGIYAYDVAESLFADGFESN